MALQTKYRTSEQIQTLTITNGSNVVAKDKALMTKTPLDQKQNENLRILLGSFLGVSVVGTIQLIAIQSLDLALATSVYCFAVSIPLLTLGLYVAIIESREQFTVESRILIYAESVGVLTAGLGIAAMFFHFSFPANWVLIILSVIALIFSGWFQRKLEQANNLENDSK
jgi:hypothetical protein